MIQHSWLRMRTLQHPPTWLCGFRYNPYTRPTELDKEATQPTTLSHEPRVVGQNRWGPAGDF